MRVGIVGVSGFIGRHLCEHLLSRSFDVVGVSRHASSLEFRSKQPHLELVDADVTDTEVLTDALQECDTAVYLVHGLQQKGYQAWEQQAAASFVQASNAAGIRRIVFLGGLGSGQDTLSSHLRSRHLTGERLRQAKCEVIELRASMVLGPGSVGYDIMQSLIGRLPILILPGHAATLMQPIVLEDVLDYITAALHVTLDKSMVVEIGGPEVLSYRELLCRYAQYCKKRRLMVRFPLLPPQIAAWWLNLFTPQHHVRTGKQMMDSLRNPMVVNDDAAGRLFPDIAPHPIESAFLCPQEPKKRRDNLEGPAG